MTKMALAKAYRALHYRMQLAEARLALKEAQEALEWENNQNRAWVPPTYTAHYQELVDAVPRALAKVTRLENKQ
jgi:hypothetical protein